MRAAVCVSVLLLVGCGAPSPHGDDEIVATFSIVAFDPATGDLGVAVQSKFLGVGVVVPWVRADVGAVATQALANPSYGPDGLELMDDGWTAKDTVTKLIAADDGRDRRQLGVVDARGNAFAWTGQKTHPWSGHVIGKHYCCQGNILVGEGVVNAMAKAFEASRGPLAERLVGALRAGQAAGGDARGRQSAALQVARRGGGYLGANDRYIDLRVDDHKKPIEELARLLKLRRKFGPRSRVPMRVDQIGRGRRHAPEKGTAGPRAVWERWKRARREKDWKSALALTISDWREKHTADDAGKLGDDRDSVLALAERGDYIGTKLMAQGKFLMWAFLYFHVPGKVQPVELVLHRESGRWWIKP